MSELREQAEQREVEVSDLVQTINEADAAQLKQSQVEADATSEYKRQIADLEMFITDLRRQKDDELSTAH